MLFINLDIRDIWVKITVLQNMDIQTLNNCKLGAWQEFLSVTIKCSPWYSLTFFFFFEKNYYPVDIHENIEH